MKQIDQNIYSKNNLKKINCTAILVLENGKIYKGYGLGFEGHATGEVLLQHFYHWLSKIISDPSYAGQIINFTFSSCRKRWNK